MSIFGVFLKRIGLLKGGDNQMDEPQTKIRTTIYE